MPHYSNRSPYAVPLPIGCLSLVRHASQEANFAMLRLRLCKPESSKCFPYSSSAQYPHRYFPDKEKPSLAPRRSFVLTEAKGKKKKKKSTVVSLIVLH